MEIERNTKLAEALSAFEALPVTAQDEIILTIERLLSEREKSPALVRLTEETI